MPSRSAQTWRPNGRLSGDGSAQARRHGGFGESYPPNLFIHPKFCCAHKNVFQTYNKIKNLSPVKMYFPPKPQNLATAWFCQNCACN